MGKVKLGVIEWASQLVYQREKRQLELESPLAQTASACMNFF
jgi:hypothetical protein